MKREKEDKRAASLKIRFGLLALALAALCFACGRHVTTQTQYAPSSVITTDDTVQVVSSDEKEKVTNGCPSQVAENSAVAISPSGKGYVLNLSWSFTGKAPQYWEILQLRDRDDGTDEFDPLAPADIRTDEKLEFQSEEMQKGRVYKFQLACATSSFSYGKVIYRSITVNLRGL